MQPGYIYKLEFPYEDGQGSKNRPVLILVLSEDKGKALGLKITGTSRSNRIEIKNSPNSGLNKVSHVQFDRYAFFDNISKTPLGKLSADDMKEIVKHFSAYHDV
ncbi:type II toxin-antitoxin system PemK/MazF family toxin [Oceanobacillus profundus]|uniref:Type II toxin-antitoxin system PemK/MazF family toxin n=1 Tax=Oceanobacillus profundus TaxID=372463 RepID=A0A417YGB4_9BACI|nr:type II toxin-antitoxin system PemK/MazF family toxin [Oceanobacillus profundus]MBR2246292.1 type II toxin-antitoxin system PemK/MazF family toxin [Bacilli bacterium]MBR3119701.1 type II toxin-antitoxin system PemK/MazF family toxin [Oceanobacillus sp.]RHW31861.1 hypothetical protein D1B32_11525 [Oceanobacillus profundus]